MVVTKPRVKISILDIVTHLSISHKQEPIHKLFTNTQVNTLTNTLTLTNTNTNTHINTKTNTKTHTHTHIHT